jgi:hypothetical protein
MLGQSADGDVLFGDTESGENVDGSLSHRVGESYDVAWTGSPGVGDCRDNGGGEVICASLGTRPPEVYYKKH